MRQAQTPAPASRQALAAEDRLPHTGGDLDGGAHLWIPPALVIALVVLNAVLNVGLDVGLRRIRRIRSVPDDAEDSVR
jgi:hypothetical protein